MSAPQAIRPTEFPSGRGTAAGSVVRGINRQLPVPACTLRGEDLRKLFRRLEGKAQEAADVEVQALQQIQGQTPEQFLGVQEAIRATLNLVVRIQGGSGEWAGGTSAEVLNDEALPDAVAQVEFDSSFLFRQATGRSPQNHFNVLLDFGRTSLLDLTNPSGEPTRNNSRAGIAGVNTTWVNGVYEELNTFFKERANRRGWIHTHYIYGLLLVTLGFPISFQVVYLVNARLMTARPDWPQALLIAFYVYLVIVSLYVFRLAFNYVRWMLPKVEGPSRAPRTGLHRVILGVLGSILLGVISSAVYSFVRVFF